MTVGKKTNAYALGCFQSCTDVNMQLKKKLHRIQCHEKGISISRYLGPLIVLLYDHIVSIDHLIRLETNAWQSPEKHYYLRITWLNQKTCQHEVLIFKHTRPMQAVYDYWVYKVTPFKD